MVAGRKWYGRDRWHYQNIRAHNMKHDKGWHSLESKKIGAAIEMFHMEANISKSNCIRIGSFHQALSNEVYPLHFICCLVPH